MGFECVLATHLYGFECGDDAFRHATHLGEMLGSFRRIEFGKLVHTVVCLLIVIACCRSRGLVPCS